MFRRDVISNNKKPLHNIINVNLHLNGCQFADNSSTFQMCSRMEMILDNRK